MLSTVSNGTCLLDGRLLWSVIRQQLTLCCKYFVWCRVEYLL